MTYIVFEKIIQLPPKTTVQQVVKITSERHDIEGFLDDPERYQVFGGLPITRTNTDQMTLDFGFHIVSSFLIRQKLKEPPYGRRLNALMSANGYALIGKASRKIKVENERSRLWCKVEHIGRLDIRKATDEYEEWLLS